MPQRGSVRSPAFTLATILTLALAIGANASIFTVLHRVVLNPLPYPDSDRLISLTYGIPARNIASGVTSMSWQLYHQYADRGRSLESVAVHNTAQATLTGGGEPERVQVARATPSLARVLRVSPALGRWFSEEEGVPGAPTVAVLSHGLWLRRFGGDPRVVGRTLTINGVQAPVVGVMPASFSFPALTPRIDMWLPAQSSSASASFLFQVMGVARLRDGVSVADARAELTQLLEDLARAAPNQRGIIATPLPLHDEMVGNVAGTLWILLASVGVVLLVACANVANLFLVRSETRQREVAVRRALGAGRGEIVGYFLSESTMLSLAGGAAGLAFAWVAVQLLVTFGPANLPRLDEVRLDAVVLSFTAGLIVLTALIFAAVSMLRVAPLASSLRDSGRGKTASLASYRMRQLLMTAQVALALVLLVASGLMVRSFQKLRAVDPGFDATSALTFSVGLPDRAYPTRLAAVAAHQLILDRLSALPRVTAASASTCLPLSGACFGNGLIVDGEAGDTLTARPFTWFRAIAGGYFEAMGIRLLRGRLIDRGDIERSEANVVVNKRFVDTYFPKQIPSDAGCDRHSLQTHSYLLRRG